MRKNNFYKFALCAVSAVLLVFASCGKNASGSGNGKKISVMATIFPQYDWAKNIIGDTKNIDLSLLMTSGVDLHSFQPSVDDMVKISKSDVFIYVGGESDQWVSKALQNVDNKNFLAINLLEVLGEKAKVEDIVEGMQPDEEHNHGGEHDEEHEGEEHGHGNEVTTFEDSEVKDRTIADWAGSWKSTYPLVLDGSLDEVWEHKSEDGTMTAVEYKEHYKAVYKSDFAQITVKGDEIAYKYENGQTVSGKYKYAGFHIRTSDTGNKSAIYRFELADKNSEAPRFVELNDHIIAPAKSGHFHIRASNQSFEAISLETSPIFFPSEMPAAEIAEYLAGGHGHGHDEEHGHEGELDEHVWLSLRNAEIFCNYLAAEFGRLDAENAAVYAENAKNYIAKLKDLDAEYKTAVAAANRDTLLVCDRFPFRYLVDDYGLNYFAAFRGCSAETEASFETVAFLSNKVNELNATNVLTIEGTTHKIAETVIANTTAKNQNVLVMDSMQAVTAKEIEAGTSYLDRMQKNLDVLKVALN